ncbi:uncharacterized protein B0J16DRAFT_397081 [Fusarium flagelliforme]|uniref:uncharacterized protein n=1 Tax=Fusarium flagelliforme TaxID=2675880 RepID=UPI001E8CC9B0|nr:uncharacterized protein B0J16DRAFT_397081 [Fusarium flagelliforme]KAH7189087.1 hypothetical protein B0J16DRAFT_397081 [Fusarium flagelliforme]
MNDEQLEAAVRSFHHETSNTLRNRQHYPTEEEVERAAKVWHHKDYYENAARHRLDTPASLNAAEQDSLVKEVDNPFSEKGMWTVVSTSSQNGANLFARYWVSSSSDRPVNSRFAFANAAVYFSAAVLGCPLAAPLNTLFGRRGAIIVAAFLILASSIGSACIPLPTSDNAPVRDGSWALLAGVRIIGGVGMGVKATSTPILAAETAVGSWRGSHILMWQLWVAFGIMSSFVVNICLDQIDDKKLTLRLILGSPAVFALILILVAYRCPESFRYHLMPGSKNYSPEKAYASLQKLRNTKLQADRDLFATHQGIANEISMEGADGGLSSNVSSSLRYVTRYYDIFKLRRLRNAAITTGIVALSQQLSGINLMAFYGGTTLVGIAPGDVPDSGQVLAAMIYNLIFGFVNFLFCLPAIYYIDTLGRRKILLYTIPGMAIGLMAAAVSYGRVKIEVVAFWIFFHTAFYSPGMGPVPFVLAAESFPLAYRETGASFAITINFVFAGLLAWLQPLLVAGINFGGTLGVFSGLNVISFFLIFFLVEQTHGTDLEYLGRVFRRSKLEFVRLQFHKLVPLFGKTGPNQDDEISSPNEDGTEVSSEGIILGSYNTTGGANTGTGTNTNV